MGKTNFNMQLTDEEKEIMDFAVTEIFKEYKFSKADLVSMLVKECALKYLNMDIEWHKISDDMVLTLLHNEKKNNDFAMLQLIGVDKYKDLVKATKEKDSNADVSYFESLIKEFEDMKGEKVNG